MKISFPLITVILVTVWSNAVASTLEERLSILEGEVERLKIENRLLKESAATFLSKELQELEKLRARAVYREQVVPLVTRLSRDMGSNPPKLPREEDIETMVDAYRPWAELIASIGSVADMK